MPVPKRPEQTGAIKSWISRKDFGMDPEWSVIISVQEDEKMAKQIDDETMENVCILAKLSLTEEEKEKAIRSRTAIGNA